MRNWNALSWAGVLAVQVGLFCTYGACGGIETGGNFHTGVRWVLIGLGLIGIGVWAMITALKRK